MVKFLVKKEYARAEEMAQWVKHLLHNHEDLSSGLQNPGPLQMVAHICNP